MQHLIANFTGRVNRQWHDGREYIVAPMTLIVPGVLPGSKGPLLYPLEEVARNPKAWNGTPILVYHPSVRGRMTSVARNPEVVQSSGVGDVRNSRFENGRLRADGWFDVERTRLVDTRVYDALIAGRCIELSTGLFTSNTPASEGSHFDGRPYTHVATNYRPDHLAILPDQVGACSLRDGCGVNNREFSFTKETTMDDQEILELPTINWDESNSPQVPEVIYNAESEEDDEILPMPTINWSN